MMWREFQRWIWLYEDRPFGETAMDARFIDLLAYYANANRKKGKKRIPMQFLGKRRKQRKRTIRQTAEQAAATVRAFAQQFK